MIWMLHRRESFTNNVYKILFGTGIILSIAQQSGWNIVSRGGDILRHRRMVVGAGSAAAVLLDSVVCVQLFSGGVLSLAAAAAITQLHAAIHTTAVDALASCLMSFAWLGHTSAVVYQNEARDQAMIHTAAVCNRR